MTPRRVRECWYRYRKFLVDDRPNPGDEPTEAELIALQASSDKKCHLCRA